MHSAEFGTTFEQKAIKGLRASLILIFFLIGLQKFTDAEAKGITEYTLHSPLTSWLTSLGYRNVSRLFGCAELTWGSLLLVGMFRPASLAALVGAAGSVGTYLVTLSFLLTTPGIFVSGQAPILGVEGLFLVKDVVLLAASVVLLAQSLGTRSQS